MLSSQLFDDIQAKIDQGDKFLNSDDFDQASTIYQEAVALIPEPKCAYEISLPAFTALGESYFFAGKYREAVSAFHMAMKAPGGVENPLLHLRFGQAYFESGDMNRSADSLTRAYALDGISIFDGEDDKYLSFLAKQIDL